MSAALGAGYPGPATAGGAALRHRALIYTEGIDLAADDPRPVPHAWNCHNGKVVDLTTLERESYFGVPIPTPIYARCVAHDKIARPVLPLLLEVGWTPAMPERVAAAHACPVWRTVMVQKCRICRDFPLDVGGVVRLSAAPGQPRQGERWTNRTTPATCSWRSSNSGGRTGTRRPRSN